MAKLKGTPPAAHTLRSFYFGGADPQSEPIGQPIEQPEPIEQPIEQPEPVSSQKENRTESISLIVSKQLDEDIRILARLRPQKSSVNDLIVEILTEYTQREDSQFKIDKFKSTMRDIEAMLQS